ncbi:MAG TPA: helix-turn-helix domain-containing protein, partial [Patescibacteria group bacterium]
MNTNLPDTKLYKIGEIAKILSVSIGTLRRWERQGKITSTRTAGGHRRYNLEAVRAIKTKKEIGAVRPAPVYAPSTPIRTPETPKVIQAPVIKSEPINFPFRRILKAGLLALVLYGLLFTVSKTHFLNKIIVYLPESIRTNIESVIGKDEGEMVGSINTSPSVLAESVSKDLSFNVNIKTNLLKDLSVGGNATVSGTLTTTGDLTTE